MTTTKDKFRPLGSSHIEGGMIDMNFGQISGEEMAAAKRDIAADKRLENWQMTMGNSNMVVAAVAYMRRKYGAAGSATSETR